MESIRVKTDGIAYEVSRTPVPKLDQNGVQKVDRETNLPLFAVELTGFASESEGAQTITVSLPSPSLPVLAWREPVEVVGLVAVPWANVRRGELNSGIAYRASVIRPLTVDDGDLVAA